MLVFVLLLIGMSLMGYVWVRKVQRQYKLDRDLITALLKNDTKQARVLVEAGADPNTKEELSPVPSLPSLVKQLLHPSPLKAKPSTTAFLLACGAGFAAPQINNIPQIYHLGSLDPRLKQAMLLHGANVHAKGREGWTALHIAVISALNRSPFEYKTDKEILTQLLDAGADPDAVDNSVPYLFGKTPMQTALAAASLNTNPNPDLVALLRKYLKHPDASQRLMTVQDYLNFDLNDFRIDYD